MPEERKLSVGPNETSATENGTSSPSKSPNTRGKVALARITLLDGTVRDFNIEVCSVKELAIVSAKVIIVFYSFFFCREKLRVTSYSTESVKV